MILGADGMIGHKISMTLQNTSHKLILNSRNSCKVLKKIIPKASFFNYDFLKHDILNLLEKVKPELVINCVGLTIRRGADKLNDAIKLNQELPHLIDRYCSSNVCKQVHFSTDCVFSGSKGNYSELDLPDATDNYGITKTGGEVLSQNTLTIRSSMIGREIFNKTELLEWILRKQNQTIDGFSRVIYSGVTTIYMASLVTKIISRNQFLTGLYNISSPPVSKFELLNKLNDKFELGLVIKENNLTKLNKSLNSNLFFTKLKYKKPDWDDMIEELFIDSKKFSELYKNIQK